MKKPVIVLDICHMTICRPAASTHKPNTSTYDFVISGTRDFGGGGGGSWRERERERGQWFLKYSILFT